MLRHVRWISARLGDHGRIAVQQGSAALTGADSSTERRAAYLGHLALVSGGLCCRGWLFPSAAQLPLVRACATLNP